MRRERILLDPHRERNKVDFGQIEVSLSWYGNLPSQALASRSLTRLRYDWPIDQAGIPSITAKKKKLC